ncbi:MAG: hypothetical protein F2744_09615 [Actinobacteria bacterium]|uniref:Unannotated protein n=1 Tax=freshwater metagenome TaxID=449393 RepID=A0A6J6ZQP7_9ZZZZ|nr:hypothetical protein [Actinomycetota bacterium]
MLPELLPEALPELLVTYRGTYVRRITTTGSGAVTGTVEEVVAGTASSATAGAAAEDAVALPPRTAMRTKVAAVETTAAACREAFAG